MVKKVIFWLAIFTAVGFIITKIKGCNNEKRMEQHSPIEPPIVHQNEIRYLYGDKYQKWIDLKEGKNSIEIPYRLIIEVGEVENKNCILHYKNQNGHWIKYNQNGKMQDLGKMNAIEVMVTEPTKIWVQYSYQSKHEKYVKQTYN